MEVKANVHKRRQERLRELKAKAPGQRYEGRTAERPEPPLWIKGPMATEHGGDPEIAWKQREVELLRQYSAETGESGSFGMPGADDGGGVRYGGHDPARKLLLMKAVIAVILFGSVWALYQIDQPWAEKGKRFVTRALTEDMDFSRMAAWYDGIFSGAPSFLPAFGPKQEAAKVHAPVAQTRMVQPVKGTIVEQFSLKKQGIWVETREDAHVAAMDNGRIEFAGQREETGYTVIVQHADGYRSTYGGLKPAKWETGDWLKAGDIISSAAAASESSGKGRVFLAVMKDQRYVDPADVVAFD